MDVWISFYSTHMANNLVKWWRTKFLNGYKQFSDCGDVRVSDTEELLGRYNSDDDNFDRIRGCQTPPSQEKVYKTTQSVTHSENEEPPKTKSSKNINLEEFLCDVSMGKNDPPGQEKQEFSFTLYDFDGHGKITKDDIAGLVTTIYEALGSSIKVPHFGSKTIKVKLTVSPEQRTNGNDKQPPEDAKNSNIRYKKDINVTICQGTKENRKYCKSNYHNRRKYHCCKEDLPPKHNCCKREEEPEEQNLISDDFSDLCSRISSNFSSEDECENDHFSENEHAPRVVKRKHRPEDISGRSAIPQRFLKGMYNNQEKCSSNKKGKNRSSSLQRQELLEIIQANMEKNNLSFQTIGKHCAPQDNAEAKSPSADIKHSNKHKVITKTESSSPLHHYLANMVEPAQFYVDLASLQKATNLPTNYKYNNLIDAVIGVSNRRAQQSSPGKHRKYNRGKVDCDKNVDYQLIDCPVNEDGVMPTPKVKKTTHSARKNTKKAHGVTGHTSSPHYLKHRNRQEDQARAMAQVVRWLEKEFSSNFTMKDRWNKTKSASGFTPEKSSDTQNSPNMVERHEHHHVHEHIHHHYHHYQDNPFVV